MNKKTFNTTLKTLKLAKNALYEVLKESVETKQTPDLHKRVAVEFAFMLAMLMAIETLIRAEMERCENKILKTVRK